MSTINLRLPNSLHKKAQEIAVRDNISMNQFIATALAEKISAYMTESYLQERAERAGALPLQAILDKVGDSEPTIEDKL